MFQKKAPAPILTPAQKVAKYIRFAETDLAQASKAGRLEAQTVHATRATAFAATAIAIQMRIDADARAGLASSVDTDSPEIDAPEAL